MFSMLLSRVVFQAVGLRYIEFHTTPEVRLRNVLSAMTFSIDVYQKHTPWLLDDCSNWPVSTTLA